MTEKVESLRDYFSSIFESCSERHNELMHVAVLTYEFDDQQVLNLALRRSLSAAPEACTSDIARMLHIVPIVIYDARKTREHNQLPHFMELLPVHARPWTCHHAKAYLVVTQRQIHLALGSMNLTRSGLFTNREVFETFAWSDTEKGDLSVLREFVEVLAKGYASFKSAPLGAAIDALRRRLARWGTPTDKGAVLIHQGYDGVSGLESLARAWRAAFGDLAPERAIAVSPFFDRNPREEVFTEDLKRTFPSLNALDVITDAAIVQSLCRDHFRSIPATRLFLIPEALTEHERQRIAQANQPASLEALAITRKLHAKVLILARGNEALVYLGSANFTRKAWCGPNHEIGVARIHRDSIDKMLDMIFSGLSAEQTDHYRDLQSSTSGEMPKSEDDYEDLSGYPEFVQGIDLVADSTGSELMAFEVRAQPQDLARLSEYEVCWGGLRLQFTDGRSNSLSQSQLIGRIIGARNLRFVRRSAPEGIYYLPFRHAAALFERRERYVLSTAEDWMLHYLNEKLTLDRDAGEYLPGDPGIGDDNDDPAAVIHAMRQHNVVVAMQQHLNLFVRIQDTFRARAAKCIKEPSSDGQPDQWKDSVEGPLTTFADVLSRDAQGRTQSSAESLFKLGELVLFAREFATESDKGHALWMRLKAKLPTRHRDAAVMEYLRFCHEDI